MNKLQLPNINHIWKTYEFEGIVKRTGSLSPGQQLSTLPIKFRTGALDNVNKNKQQHNSNNNY